MVSLLNTAEGGDDGGFLTLYNTGGLSGSPLQVSLHSPATITFDSTVSEGELAYYFHAGTTSGAGHAYLSWGIDAPTVVAGGFELYLGAQLAGPFILAAIGRFDATPLTLTLNTDATLSLIEVDGAVVATTTSTIPVGAWCRIAWAVTPANTDAGAGHYTVVLYPDRDTTVGETLSDSGGYVWAWPGPATYVQFGPGPAHGIFSLWLDNLAANDTGTLPPPHSAFPHVVGVPSIQIQLGITQPAVDPGAALPQIFNPPAAPITVTPTAPTLHPPPATVLQPTPAVIGIFPVTPTVSTRPVGVLTVTVHWTVTDTAPRPHLWFVNPTHGAPGSTVTLYGQGFAAQTGLVTLAGKFAAITEWTHVAATAYAQTPQRAIGPAEINTEHDRAVIVVPDVKAPGGPLVVEAGV